MMSVDPLYGNLDLDDHRQHMYHYKPEESRFLPSTFIVSVPRIQVVMDCIFQRQRLHMDRNEGLFSSSRLTKRRVMEPGRSGTMRIATVA